MEQIKEGDIYKVITIDGTTLEIRYGYESPEEKKRGWEPTPIFPEFDKVPQYTREGYPIVTVYQNVCKHYRAREKVSSESWCENCRYYEGHERYVGLCKCSKRKRRDMEVKTNDL